MERWDDIQQECKIWTRWNTVNRGWAITVHKSLAALAYIATGKTIFQVKILRSISTKGSNDHCISWEITREKFHARMKERHESWIRSRPFRKVLEDGKTVWPSIRATCVEIIANWTLKEEKALFLNVHQIVQNLSKTNIINSPEVWNSIIKERSPLGHIGVPSGWSTCLLDDLLNT